MVGGVVSTMSFETADDLWIDEEIDPGLQAINLKTNVEQVCTFTRAKALLSSSSPTKVKLGGKTGVS